MKKFLTKEEAFDTKFKVEVQFSKNVHYPEYGSEAYSIESHSIFIRRSVKPAHQLCCGWDISDPLQR